MQQQAINDLLVAEAKRGKLVVRLKGGDPFIFGRGGEEADACRAAGVAVSIIPGISAAMGAAAAAMLPLTHRSVSSAITLVAGQCQGLSAQNWNGLAGTGRTLVIYMGIATADLIAEKLIAEGVAPGTTVAVLENGTRPGARALRTVLADLGSMIARESVRSPAIIIVGEVAAMGTADDALLSLQENVDGLA